MTYSFRPARKGSAKLLVGVFSESGNGKTYSSLLLARGFVGPNGTIGMIETESGRGEIYQDVIPGGYAVCSLTGEFSPEAYGKAITLAEQAGFGALIIDSASHEWESIGGVLDMAAKNQADGKKGPLVWQRPKLDHAKHFVLRLMASPIPLIIVNMRAKYPMKEIEKNGKKEWTRSQQLEPKQSEDILYEMLIHGWIDEQHRYHVTKYPKAIPELRDVVRDGEPLTIETGQRLAAWAAGTKHTEAQTSAPARAERTDNSSAASVPVPSDEEIIDQLEKATSAEKLTEAADLARAITNPTNKERASTAYKATLRRLRETSAQV
jgi:hypothetical protein